MAAPTTNPGVTFMLQPDAPATITTGKVKIRKIVLVSATLACTATITDGGDRVIAKLAAPAGSSDEIDFNADSFAATGLKVSAIGGDTSSSLFIYGG